MSAGGLSCRQPVVAADDALGAFGQFHGCLAVVGAVTHVLAQNSLGFACMALGGCDRGQVQSGDLLVWGGRLFSFRKGLSMAATG